MRRSAITALSLVTLAVGCERHHDVSVDATISLSEEARAAVTGPSIVAARFVVDSSSGERFDLGHRVITALCDDDDALSAEPVHMHVAWGPCQQADLSLEVSVVPIDDGTCGPQSSWTPPGEPDASLFLVALDGCGAWTDEVSITVE